MRGVYSPDGQDLLWEIWPIKLSRWLAGIILPWKNPYHLNNLPFTMNLPNKNSQYNLVLFSCLLYTASSFSNNESYAYTQL